MLRCTLSTNRSTTTTRVASGDLVQLLYSTRVAILESMRMNGEEIIVLVLS